MGKRAGHVCNVHGTNAFKKSPNCIFGWETHRLTASRWARLLKSDFGWLQSLGAFCYCLSTPPCCCGLHEGSPTNCSERLLTAPSAYSILRALTHKATNKELSPDNGADNQLIIRTGSLNKKKNSRWSLTDNMHIITQHAHDNTK